MPTPSPASPSPSPRTVRGRGVPRMPTLHHAAAAPGGAPPEDAGPPAAAVPDRPEPEPEQAYEGGEAWWEGLRTPLITAEAAAAAVRAGRLPSEGRGSEDAVEVRARIWRETSQTLAAVSQRRADADARERAGADARPRAEEAAAPGVPPSEAWIEAPSPDGWAAAPAPAEALGATPSEEWLAPPVPEPAAPEVAAEPPAQAAAAPATPLERLDALRRGEGERPFAAPGADLSGADLAGLDLAGADLRGANLADTNLAGTHLLGARLTGASLQRACLDDAELTGADLGDAHLEEAHGERVGLAGARLAGARLDLARLPGCSLTRADLQGANLHCADLTGARLREADLRRADLTGARLPGADLGACRVEGAHLDDVDLRDAILGRIRGYESATWIGADLREAHVAGAHQLRRFAMDQNYIDELRRSGPRGEWIYRLWWLSSDCGRSLSRWSLWVVAQVIAFAWVYTLVGVDWGAHATALSPLYYSVVTLTTLGYGDVVPTSVAGQAVAMVEVFLGYVMLGGLLSILSNKMARRAT